MKKITESKSSPRPFFADPLKEKFDTVFPERTLELGFVFLDEDPLPKPDKSYPVISASDEKLLWLDVPAGTYKHLHLDLLGLHLEDFPQSSTKKNNGFLKIGINTKDPQHLNAPDKHAIMATNFTIGDEAYAPSFSFRSMFRNVIFKDLVHLKFDLFELDTETEEHFAIVKKMVNNVAELKYLDILKGTPYLTLAKQLLESILNVFGKNCTDHLWGEVPVLAIEPIVGSAFLRSGVYVLYEKVNSKNQMLSPEHMVYRNGTILSADTKAPSLPNHLLFGIGLGKYER